MAHALQKLPADIEQRLGEDLPDNFAPPQWTGRELNPIEKLPRASTIHATPAPAVHGLRVANRLADEITKILWQNMENPLYGTRLSDDHADGLRALVHLIFHMINGRSNVNNIRGRIGVPMGVGRGKTQTAVAVAAGMHLFSTPYSIVIAQRDVEAGAKTKRDIKALGVPEEAIAFVTSYKYAEDPELREDIINQRPHKGTAGFTSERPVPVEVAKMDADGKLCKDKAGKTIMVPTDFSSYRIVILTHEMLNRRDFARFNSFTYRGQTGERSILIYDEALRKGIGQSLSLLDIIASADRLQLRLMKRADPIAQQAVDYLRESLQEMADWKPTDRAKYLKHPLSPEQRLAFTIAVRALPRYGKNDIDETAVPVAETFFAFSPAEIRIVKGQGADAIIKYRILIPNTIKRVLVLDAGFELSALNELYDGEITKADIEIGETDNSDMVIGRLSHASGREKLDKELASGGDLLKAIVERLMSYPADEARLVFTRIPVKRKPDHEAAIKDALKAAGADLNERLPNGKRKWNWLTWGRELGMSSFSYVQNIMLVGVYRKTHADYAADIVLAADDINHPDAGDSAALRRHELSDIFQHLYQAAGRGAMRVTHCGKAQAMRLDFILPARDSFPEWYWNKAFPGATRTEWTSKYLTPKTAQDRVAKAMGEALDNVPEDVSEVTSRTLNSLAGVTGLNGAILKGGRESALADRPDWTMTGPPWKYVRNPFG